MASISTINTGDLFETTSRTKINDNFSALNTELATLNTELATCIHRDGSVDFTADQSMGTHKITNVVDPVADQDADTKKAREDYVDNLNFNARYGNADDEPDRNTSSDSYVEETNCVASIVVKDDDVVEIDLTGIFYCLTANTGLFARIYLKSGSATIIGSIGYVRSRICLTTGANGNCKALYRATADGTLEFTMYWKREGTTVAHCSYRKILAKVIGKYSA